MTAATLRSLRDFGVRLAIDDFGAGYAGLSYLRTCPVDALKIDRSYVAGLGRNQDDAAMIRAVLGLAATLGLDVTAEGIETDAARRAGDADAELGVGLLRRVGGRRGGGRRG